MNAVIISLEEAVNNGLKDAELLEKSDIIVFLYPQGKDTISIQVHNQLSIIKAKTEFKEIVDKVSDTDILVNYAYLAGYYAAQGYSVSIISADDRLLSITSNSVSLCASFKGVSKGKTTKTVTPTKRGRKKKSEKNDDKQIAEKEQDISELIKPIPEDFMVEPIEIEKINSIPEDGNKNENKLVSGLSSEIIDMDDFKSFIAKYETKTFKPQTYAVSIYKIIKAVSESDKDIEKEIENNILYDAHKGAMKKLLTEHFDEIKKLADKMSFI